MTRTVILGLCLLAVAAAETLPVGPASRFSKPCAALAAAHDGDTIEIDAAGSYAGDVCSFSQNNLLIRGVNGKPRIDAAGKNAAGKGVWVVDGNDTIIENVEISGAAVPDQNGAAVRLEGINLTLRRVYFHDNEEGLLTNGRGGDILIEYSEFDRNGDGVGYAHNIYVGYERSLTIRFSYSHRARGGNLIKSRAAENYLYYNRLMSEDADSSWEVELSNGGYSVLVGNLIQQGAFDENFSILAYMAEGPRPGYSNYLHMAFNTVVNEGAGGDLYGDAYMLFTTPDQKFGGLIANNIFSGPGKLATDEMAANLQFLNNLTNQDPMFAAPAQFDYRLQDGSPAIGGAAALPDDLSALLTPVWQNQPPACGLLRPDAQPPSLGAYEIGPEEVNTSDPCVVPLEGLRARLAFSVPLLTSSLRQTVRVHLSGVAPPEGALVQLQYSHPDLVQGPPNVLIPGGESSIPVELQCNAPSAAAIVTVTAVYKETSVDSYLNFPIPTVVQPVLTRLLLYPSELTGGSSTSGNVVLLAAPAPAAGIVVSLISSRPDLVVVPQVVQVAAGKLQASFVITTAPVTERTIVDIVATQDNVQITVRLIVNPVALGHLSVPGRTLGGPGIYTGTVALTGPAPAGGIAVQMLSDNPAVLTVPPLVTVLEGRSSTTFTISVAAVSGPANAIVTAQSNGAGRSFPLAVDVFSITALRLSPATAPGGLTSGSHRVVLNSPAPDGAPITILLSSSNPEVARVPSSVVIGPGLSSASFQIVTAKVASPVRIEIRAVAATPMGGTSDVNSVLTLTP